MNLQSIFLIIISLSGFSLEAVSFQARIARLAIQVSRNYQHNKSVKPFKLIYPKNCLNNKIKIPSVVTPSAEGVFKPAILNCEIHTYPEEKTQEALAIAAYAALNQVGADVHPEEVRVAIQSLAQLKDISSKP